jgi:hypothetical protein
MAGIVLSGLRQGVHTKTVTLIDTQGKRMLPKTLPSGLTGMASPCEIRAFSTGVEPVTSALLVGYRSDAPSFSRTTRVAAQLSCA